MAGPINGEEFSMTLTTTKPMKLSQDLVKEHFKNDPQTLASFYKESVVHTMKSTRIKGEKAKFTMPNLANATPGGLSDMLGKVREEIKDLKKLEGIYKTALAARAGIELAKKGEGDDEE